MARRAGRPLEGRTPEGTSLEEKSPASAFAFWDASALVPLCVRQTFTPKVASLHKKFRAVVWWATPVEIASALARLLRTGEINPGDWAKARRVTAALADEWSVIQPSSVLRDRALQLLDRYDLKAADAIQLAAALEWCENSPRGEVFLAADQRLRQAAELSGFDAPSLR